MNEDEEVHSLSAGVSPGSHGPPASNQLSEGLWPDGKRKKRHIVASLRLHLFSPCTRMDDAERGRPFLCGNTCGLLTSSQH